MIIRNKCIPKNNIYASTKSLSVGRLNIYKKMSVLLAEHSDDYMQQQNLIQRQK